MANIPFESYNKRSTTEERVKVGYFNSLKDDGDETLVRLNYTEQKDFTVTTVHRVSDGGKFKDIACLKESLYDSEDKCPLCKASANNKNLKMTSRIYVMLLEYSKNEAGQIVASPKVWTRGVGFVGAVLEAMNDAIEDGKIPAGTKIRDVVFKVKRSGAKGSLETTYKVKVMNPAVCPNGQFSSDFSAFRYFDASKTCYWTKSAEEMNTFLTTGSFPEPVKEEGAPKEEPAEEDIPTHPGIAEDAEVFDAPTQEEPAPAKEEPKAEEEKAIIRRYGW